MVQRECSLLLLPADTLAAWMSALVIAFERHFHYGHGGRSSLWGEEGQCTGHQCGLCSPPAAMASTPWAGPVLANKVLFQASTHLSKHLPNAGPGSQREWEIAVIRPAKKNVQNCHSDNLVVKKQYMSLQQQGNGLNIPSPIRLVKAVSKLTLFLLQSSNTARQHVSLSSLLTVWLLELFWCMPALFHSWMSSTP